MNSKRKCALKTCGLRFRVETGIIKGVNAWCSEAHMVEWAIAAGRKLTRAKEKAVEREFRQRVRREDRASQFDATKRMAQRLANLLDAARDCICCWAPRASGVQFCGGHFKTAGAHRELALDLRNIHGQRNVTCNQHKSGNISGDKHSHGYRAGLIERYGPELVAWLEGPHAPAKLTGEELEALRKLYSKEVRRLMSGLGPSRDWRSLSLPGLRALAVAGTHLPGADVVVDDERDHVVGTGLVGADAGGNLLDGPAGSKEGGDVGGNLV